MILVTHAIIGGALTQRFSSIGGAFIVGIVSHYIADMIPHWHYPVPSVKKAVGVPYGKKTISLSRDFLQEMIMIAVDLSFGMALAIFFFQGSMTVIIAGAFGGVLPDLLVGLGRTFPNKLFGAHDAFHRWIHTDLLLDDRLFFGILSQAMIAVGMIFLFQIS